MKLIGYHGTSALSVEGIMEKNFSVNLFKHTIGVRQDMPGDLGNGVYIFIDDQIFVPKINAEKYASKYRTKPTKVLEIKAEIPDEYLLDMDEQGNIDMFLSFKEKSKQRAESIFKSIKSNGSKDRKNLDGIYTELMLLRYSIPCEAIKKRTFTDFNDGEKRSNYPNGTELCIRKVAYITNKKVL